MPARKRTDTTQRAHPNDYKKSAKDVAAARRYDQQAINQAFQLYLKFNGQRHDRIEEEMRADWPGWSKQRLYGRSGWIQKYAWDAALAIKISADKDAALNSADRLVKEIETVRARLYKQLNDDGVFDGETVKAHKEYAKLSIDALIKIKEARDTLGAFAAMWERLMSWLPDYSNDALEALLQVEEDILTRAAKELGTEEGSDE